MEEKRRMDQNLVKKLEWMRLMTFQPACFIADCFYDTRNAIDYDVESLLEHMAITDDDDDADELAIRANRSRDEFIRILGALEELLLGELVSKSAPTEDFERLVRKVAEFQLTAAGGVEICKLEEAYVQLALEIEDKAKRRAESLLGGQTVTYVPRNDGREVGWLVYLTEHFLDRHELAAFELDPEYVFDYCEIYIAIHASLNSEMAVGVSRPVVLTENLMIIHGLIQFFWTKPCLDSNVVCVGGGARVPVHVSELDAQALLRSMLDGHADFFTGLECLSFEGTRLRPGAFKHVDFTGHSVALNGSRLSNLDPELIGVLGSAYTLNLSNNEFERFDTAGLGVRGNLRELEMISSCLPSVDFSLDFLRSLDELVELRLTLPPTMPDLAVFQNLRNLDRLELYGAPSLDRSNRPPVLTKQALLKLSWLEKLCVLKLGFFDLGFIDQETLAGFKEVRELNIDKARIVRVHPEAAKACKFNSISVTNCQIGNFPAGFLAGQNVLVFLTLESNAIRRLNRRSLASLSRLSNLSLSGNQIRRLPRGVFDDLVNLNFLDLTRNRIEIVKRGTFTKLHSLIKLTLDHNPIRKIEAGSLSIRLEHLSLQNCRLRSLNNLMFAGLTKLYKLFLDNNRIRAIVVLADGVRTVISGLVGSSELEIVRKNLFCDLSGLWVLSLNGNRFAKFDMNCLVNLRHLWALNLANNAINELNAQVGAGTLTLLARLELGGNRLAHVSAGAFSKSVSLRHLGLAANKLTALDENFFAPFQRLECVNLQSNDLTMPITPITLATCSRSLRLFNLRDNRRVQIEDGAFEKLPFLLNLMISLPKGFRGQLRTETEPDSLPTSFQFMDGCWQRFDSIEFELNLQGSDPIALADLLSNQSNQAYLAKVENFSAADSSLTSLDGFDMSARFFMLTALDLSWNRLKRLESAWFANLPNLWKLDLSKNMIETLDDPDVFKGIPGLAEISLKGNRLRRVHRRLFKDLVKLEKIDLSRNAALSGIDSGLFRGLLNLCSLSLAGNKMAAIDLASLFDSCRQLESLDLSGNDLGHKSINEAALSGSIAQNLETLILAGNLLENIDFISGLKRLQKLDVSQNRIQSNDFGLLLQLERLNHLNLSGNRISSVNSSVFSQLKRSLEFLDISNNPFEI